MEEERQQPTEVAHPKWLPAFRFAPTTSAEQQRHNATHDKIDRYHGLYAALV